MFLVVGDILTFLYDYIIFKVAQTDGCATFLLYLALIIVCLRKQIDIYCLSQYIINKREASGKTVLKPY